MRPLCVCVCPPPIKFFPRRRWSCQPLSREYQREEQLNLKSPMCKMQKYILEKNKRLGTRCRARPSLISPSETVKVICRLPKQKHICMFIQTQRWNISLICLFLQDAANNWETLCSFWLLKLNVSSFLPASFFPRSSQTSVRRQNLKIKMIVWE